MNPALMDEEPSSPLTILEDEVLDAMSPVLGLIGAPAVTYALWIAVDNSTFSWILFAEVMTVYATAALVVLFEGRRRWRAAALTIGGVGISLLSLMHFGPVLGVGFLAAMSAICAVFFYRRLGAAVLTALIVGIFALMGVSDAIPVLQAPGLDSIPVLIRVGLTFVMSTLAVSAFTYALIRSLEDVLDKVEGARRGELRAQAERERAVSKAASTQHVEALGRLVGGVAHDFNNTLAILRLNLELLDERVRSDREQSEILGDMSQAIDAADATTQQLRAFVTDDAEAADCATPGDVIPRFVDRVRRLLEEDIRIETSLGNRSDAVPLSAGALDQMMLNLCLNSRDAGASVVEIGNESNGEQVHIWVEDDGEGIPKEVAEHVFEPFYSTKGSSGTGLGLAMICRTLEDAGGTIELTTTQGEGTRFDIRLPATVPERSTESERGRELELVDNSQILLVEDRTHLLKAMTRQLERVGFSVSTASSVASAHAAAQVQRVDLLCTDGLLPDGRASDVVRLVEQAQGREVLVVVCSAYPEEQVIPGAPVGDRCHFLAKPFRTQSLAELIKSAIEGKRLEPALEPDVDRAVGGVA